MAKPKKWLSQGARFSKCEKYRYRLWRQWCPNLDWLHFCMLNPSTADEWVEDPTVTRCINYAMNLGYGGLIVTNLFAYRATDPKELYKQKDPVGDGNDFAIMAACVETAKTICAWGVHGAYKDRGLHVLKSIIQDDAYVLGLTKEGHPRHPLYLKKDLQPQSWRDILWMAGNLELIVEDDVQAAMEGLTVQQGRQGRSTLPLPK